MAEKDKLTPDVAPLHLDLNGMTQNPNFQKEILQDLECPVCLEIALPPITQCKNGHLVCAICRKDLTQCVMCRSDYTETRNYAIESIVSKIATKCRYSSCLEVHRLGNLLNHLKICDYQPVLCNSKRGTPCTDKLIDFDQFVHHVTDQHEALVRASSCPFKMEISSDTKRIINSRNNFTQYHWRKAIYTHDGSTFILNRIMENAVVYFWISTMLNKAQAENYVADLHIGQESATGKVNLFKRNIKWTVGVLSVHDPFSNIKETMDCIAYPARRLISISGGDPNDSNPTDGLMELNIRKK